jgi:adenosine deaminase
MSPTHIDGLPKAVLHDHLDGGLRVETVIELADACGHRLPSTDPGELADWFDRGASGTLERYLAAFTHTVAVMQTPEGLERIAFEAVEDHASDGVVYAEIRFDPGLCTRGSMDRVDVIEAVLAGFDRAERATGLRAFLIVTALRHLDDSRDAARAAVRFAGDGVVGFDIAGPERGHPPDVHLPAIRIARDAGLGITIHAGEGDGPHSIWRALARCDADRIGHGVHVADCTDFDGTTIGALDPFAARVRDLRVPLEVSVSSNLDTGTYADGHPLGALYRAGFNVSINTDNRLMSGVTVSSEYALAMQRFGLTVGELGDITVRAIEAGFGPWPLRRRVIDEVVRPAWGMT